jgi:hypothetical protein
MKEKFELPHGFVFKDLQLRRDWAARGFSVGNDALLDQFLAHNGIDPALLEGHRSRSLIRFHAVAACYRLHIAQGGAPDEIMEQSNAGTLHL